MAVVAFCPSQMDINSLASTVKLKTNPFVLTPPPPQIRWVAHVASQLAKTAEPLILVFHGETSVHAPALGFSRRSLSRPAHGYVLVDPVMPQVGGEYGDWPDAPVTVVLTNSASELAKEASLQARLRGWNVTHEPLTQVLSQY